MIQQRLRDNSWYYRTIQDLFAEVCATLPNKTAIVFNDEKITFSQLKQRIDMLSQALINLGVGKGDVVAMLPSPTPEFTYLHYAVLQIGAVLNPINLLWGELELKGVLPRNNPKVIVTVDDYGKRDYIQLLKDSIPDLQWQGDTVNSVTIPALTHFVSLSRQGKHHRGFIDFNDLIESGQNVDTEMLSGLVKASKPTDIQLMCQTSGTTGLSKTALWDHRPPLSSANFGLKNTSYENDDTYINLAPLYHNSGLNSLNMTLTLAGSTVYLMEQFNPVEAIDIIRKYKVTTCTGFDAHWQGLKRAPNFNEGGLTINKAVIAGEPKTYDLVKGMFPNGVTALQLYAQTENGPLVSLGDHDCVDEEINKYTNGRPLPGVQVVIKSIDTGKRLVQGEAGEICYKSPYMFRGYYKQEKETQDSFDSEGYFHSGDFGAFDNGYITFMGRLGGVVKSGGENVSTLRVTNLLLERFPEDFEDVNTVGVPDEYWGTKIVALVRTKENKSLLSTQELREACKGHMADYEIPRDFIHWNQDWPISPEGKVEFKKLEKFAAEHIEAVVKQ